MPPAAVIGAIAILALAGYAMGRRKSRAAVGGRLRELHSTPGYYGGYVALWCGLPALVVVAGWSLAQPAIVEAAAAAALPAETRALPPARFDLAMSDVRNLAAGCFCVLKMEHGKLQLTDGLFCKISCSSNSHHIFSSH